MKKLGIVIPFNNDKYLDKVINSIYTQLFDIEIIKEYNENRATGRNNGFFKLRKDTDIVLFIDADTILSKYYIDNLCSKINNYNEVIIGHRSSTKILHLDDNILNYILSDKKIYNYELNDAKWNDCDSNNFTISYKYFRTTSGFFENYRGWGIEDVDFFYRLGLKNTVFKKTKGMVAYHENHDKIISRSKLQRNIDIFFTRFPEAKNLSNINIAFKRWLNCSNEV